MKNINRKVDPIDWVGYEVLIKYIEDNGIHRVDGDFVEIGTLFGGGAKKLALFLKKHTPSKKLYVIDIFDPSFDVTKNTHGDIMSDLYLNVLKRFQGKTQWQIFKEVISKQNNMAVIKCDSKKAKIPARQIAFTFIDGNHQPDYIINDFYLVWRKTTIGGAVSFHDYGGDLPQVTEAINLLIERHKNALKIHKVPGRSIIFLQKI